MLVRMTGSLMQQFKTGTEDVLLLEDDAHLFSVHLPLDSVDGLHLREGSLLDVVGICVSTGSLHTDNTEWRPEAFQLLAASPHNIIVRTTPSLWTRQRLFVAVAGVSSILALCLLWANTLRQRVKSQTTVIKQQWRREATLEERNRIARELHDTLAQSFAGSAFALESVASQLRREEHPIYPHVEMALRTVRSGLTEARHSLMNLRAAPLESHDLITAIRDSARGLAEDAGVRLHLRLSPPGLLTEEVETAFYRIAVEAMANAVRHGAPRNLTVELGVSQQVVNLCVDDDGVGFDTAGMPPEKHYGLVGLKERADQIHANLRIVSSPGGGTQVSLGLSIAPSLANSHRNTALSAAAALGN